MLGRTIFVLFLFGIKCGSGRPQNDVVEAREDVAKDGFRIKMSEVGASGSGAKFGSDLRNFRNPVLEYLLDNHSLRKGEGNTVREVHHGQMLLVPHGNALSPLANPYLFGNADPQRQPTAAIYGEKMPETSVTSPTLHLNKNRTRGQWIKMETFPAAAVVVNTYGEDGTLKSSVTHFRTPGNVGAPPTFPPFRNVFQWEFSQPAAGYSQGSPPNSRISWPFAGYFPIIINDPFIAAYNGITSSMYNTFSSMIEYGPEADICRKKGSSTEVKPSKEEGENVDEVKLLAELRLIKPTTEKRDEVFGDIATEKKGPRALEGQERAVRDTTGITMRFKNGDRVNVQLEEPKNNGRVFLPVEPEERTRAHSVMFVNSPPLSSIQRPTNPGFNIRKKGTKPQKPDKEGNEGSSEEVGEEQEESNNLNGSSDGVAISPPPDGASVAEAKPVGLAIAGPGGVAAAKPQGTAVAGPGGLAIARPIGTAIAGVEVEGAVPIGGQQKNKKKKPKQDPEQMNDQMDTELHYVGGLTGPIGHPQPNLKDFGKSSSARSRSQDNLLIQGKFNNDGYQLKLGERDGKYGFLPFMSSPQGATERIQKRMDTPMFFHGLLGSRYLQPQAAQNHQLYSNYHY